MLPIASREAEELESQVMKNENMKGCGNEM